MCQKIFDEIFLNNKNFGWNEYCAYEGGGTSVNEIFFYEI